MKFSIVRSKFLDGLQRIQNVVSGRGTLQILQNAMIEAEGDRLCMTTTDLDISERCYVECQIEEPGSTTLPIRRLASIIRELDEGKIMVEVDEDDVATVQSGSSYFKIIGMSVRDFTVPVNRGPCYRIDQCVTRDVTQTSYAISQDETRRVPNGVLMAFKDNKLTMAATDGSFGPAEQEIELRRRQKPN